MNSTKLVAPLLNILAKQEFKTAQLQLRLFHSSTPCFYPGNEWRKKKGFSANPNAYGPLTDLPDYSFIDGRRAPPGSGKVRRAGEQKEITEKIMQLSSEVDFAVERQKRLEKEEAGRKQLILESKLKPKWTKSQNKPPSLSSE